jgi:hypothetical protein
MPFFCLRVDHGLYQEIMVFMGTRAAPTTST